MKKIDCVFKDIDTGRKTHATFYVKETDVSTIKFIMEMDGSVIMGPLMVSAKISEVSE